jgi:hypothetical protein
LKWCKALIPHLAGYSTKENTATWPSNARRANSNATEQSSAPDAHSSKQPAKASLPYDHHTTESPLSTCIPNHSPLNQETTTRVLDLSDDDESALAILLKYLYTYEISRPAFLPIATSLQLLIIGDKYSLPRIHTTGLQNLANKIAFLTTTDAPWVAEWYPKIRDLTQPGTIALKTQLNAAIAKHAHEMIKNDAVRDLIASDGNLAVLLVEKLANSNNNNNNYSAPTRLFSAVPKSAELTPFGGAFAKAAPGQQQAPPAFGSLFAARAAPVAAAAAAMQPASGDSVPPAAATAVPPFVYSPSPPSTRADAGESTVASPAHSGISASSATSSMAKMS